MNNICFGSIYSFNSIGRIDIGAAVGISYNSGEFTFSYGFDITGFGKHYATGSSGTEIRNSFMVNYDNGRTGFSLGTNFWGGGVTDKKTQRTGMIGFRSGDFNIHYENDGAPFNKLGNLLVNNTDMLRTAAIGVGIGNFSLQTNLFTGLSGADEKGLPFDEAIKNPELVDFTVGRGFGMWKNDKADDYRLGALTISYKGLNIGVNSEHVRDLVQNWFAHTIFPGAQQPGFNMLSRNWEFYSIYKTQTRFTLW